MGDRKTRRDPEETDESHATAEEELGEDPLAEKEKLIEELTDGLKRLQAEFENFKKRMDRDWNERVKLASEKVVLDMLSVLDTFDKALEDSRSNDDVKRLKKGFESIHRQFLQAMQRQGLREIRAEGEFDPFIHEAVMTEETDEVEEGRILELLQKGYALGNNVIRPARVKVSKRKTAAEEEGREIYDKEPPEGGSPEEEK